MAWTEYIVGKGAVVGKPKDEHFSFSLFLHQIVINSGEKVGFIIVTLNLFFIIFIVTITLGLVTYVDTDQAFPWCSIQSDHVSQVVI